MPVHTLDVLADRIGGEVSGSPVIEISGVADLSSAQPGQISFLGNRRYLSAAKLTKASALIIGAEMAAEAFPCPTLLVDNPSTAFSQIAALFAPEPITYPPGVHPTAVLGSGVILGEGVSIQPHVVLERGVHIGARSVIGAGVYLGAEARIGQDCLLYPHVTVREYCVLGDRVILHCGVVVGSDGFGYDFQGGRHVKIPQTGYVQIDDDVEIGANSTIDRGRFGRTWIQRGTKIDNLVMIGHNVVVGEHNILVSQSGIAGSTLLGNYVTVAGQSGIGGHLRVGDQATITGQSGVVKDVPAKAIISGRHAIPHRESLSPESASARIAGANYIAGRANSIPSR
jgi:UDP-3-O-[3-hydroxymyristoyl] glucosamine N-acyltransferase